MIGKIGSWLVSVEYRMNGIEHKELKRINGCYIENAARYALELIKAKIIKNGDYGDLEKIDIKKIEITPA